MSIWAPNVWAICKENGDFTHPISDSYSINCAPIKTASITTESNIKGVAKKSRRGFSIIASMIFFSRRNLLISAKNRLKELFREVHYFPVP